MKGKNLHSSLKPEVLHKLQESGICYKHVRSHYGKKDSKDSLHIYPFSLTSSQRQDHELLLYLGYHRCNCPFHGGISYCRFIEPPQDFKALVQTVRSSFEKFKIGVTKLRKCGFFIDKPRKPLQPGFFSGRRPQADLLREHSPKRQVSRVPRSAGDGHTASGFVNEKSSEDENFYFKLTKLSAGNRVKGWTTHYRPKQMPIKGEFLAVFYFLGDLTRFDDCPSFDFESCWWRYMLYREGGTTQPGNAGAASDYFNNLSTCFTPGIEKLLEAHADLDLYNMSFLSPDNSSVPATIDLAIDVEKESPTSKIELSKGTCTKKNDTEPENVYCHTISHWGTEYLNKAQYKKLLKTMNEYDMFIDGLTQEALCRESNGKVRTEKITPKEIGILRDYIKDGGILRPHSTTTGSECSSIDSACKLFEVARKKVDEKLERYKFRAFITHRNPTDPKLKSYEFAPPDKLAYCLILPD